MRMGRLSVFSEGNATARFVVVPEDGGEEIELRVAFAEVRFDPAKPVVAEIGCYVHEADVADVFGRRVQVSGNGDRPAVFPDANAFDADGGLLDDCRSARWTFKARGSPGELVLDRVGGR